MYKNDLESVITDSIWGESDVRSTVIAFTNYQPKLFPKLKPTPEVMMYLLGLMDKDKCPTFDSLYKMLKDGDAIHNYGLVLEYLDARVSLQLELCLIHRFGQPENTSVGSYFSTRGQIDEHLTGMGILEKVYDYLYVVLRGLLNDVDEMFVKYRVNKTVNGDVGILGFSQKMTMVSLPYVTIFDRSDSSLWCSEVTENQMAGIFDQTFELIHKETLYIDVLDSVSNRYRVYRRGDLAKGTPGTYAIEPIADI